MNKAEFIGWLRDAEGSDCSRLVEDFMHRDPPDSKWNKEYLENTPELDGVTFELKDEGGGMDEGSNYYAVYLFTLPNGEEFALRFSGYYASHYGADYEDMEEVKPQEKVVTEWV